MTAYTVTEHAEGMKEVAGVRNPGVGETLSLSDAQAAHALRQGHIRRQVTAKKAEPVAFKGYAKRRRKSDDSDD